MKRKYFVSTGVLVLSSLSINSYLAKATLRSRVSGAVRSFFNSSNLISNLKIPTNLEEKASTLINRGQVLGAKSNEFDLTNPSNFNKTYFYHKYIDGDGRENILTSKSIPKIKDIENSTVKITYKDTNGDKKYHKSHGIPRWVQGSEIQAEYKKILNESEKKTKEASASTYSLEKLNTGGNTDILSNVPKSYFAEDYISEETKNLITSSSFARYIKNLSDNNQFIGLTSKELDFSDISKLNLNYFYYQFRDPDGYVTTFVSKTPPKIVRVNGENVTVKYKNLNGEVTYHETKGIPRWLFGSDIYKENKSKIKLTLAELKAEEPLKYKTLLSLEEPASQTIDNLTIETSNLTENLKISSKLKNKVDKLIEQNKITGKDISDFDNSLVKKLYFNHFYYQDIDSDGNIINFISKEEPKVLKVDDNNVTVQYINENGEKSVLTTNGLSRWLSGLDIKRKLRKDAKVKKQLEETPSDDATDDLSHLGAAAPIQKHSSSGSISESDSEEVEGLITGKANKQRKNEYLSSAGLGLINYGFQDNSESITHFKNK